MVLKRKAASTLVKEAEEIKEQAQASKVEAVVMEKAAAAHAKAQNDDADAMDDQEPEEEEEEQEEEKEEEISEEEKQKELEKQEVVKRTKELKSTPVDKIKKLATSKGLDLGNKQDMINGILTLEAKARADARAHEAKVRAVVTEKKEELEALSVPELTKLCQASGVKGTMTKQDRMQHLLKNWQEDDGVEKALKQKAYEERKVELEAMDKEALQSLCEHAGIDPFISEVIVDRIAKKEHEMGRFEKPMPLEKVEAAPKGNKDVDIVTALIDSEKNRKKEQEAKAKKEEALKERMKELHNMTAQDLKGALAKQSVDAIGKKDDMVRALFEIRMQEDKVKERKAELKAMGQQALKELCGNLGLKKGPLAEMVTTILTHEAKVREELLAYDAKVNEVLLEKKEELNGKTNLELKDLCASKGLKPGITKEERVERLLEEARRTDVDTLVARMIRKARKDQLAGLSKEELVKISEQIQADPLAKEAMVERILEYEREFGHVELPRSKKARVSKK